MNMLQLHQKNYLEYCQFQKRLDSKTLKAYQIDLTQFLSQISVNNISEITPAILESFIVTLHQKYKPKTAKRKIASLKAFFHYLEYREVLEKNPFQKLRIRFREPIILPKTIPLHTIEIFLSTIYKQQKLAQTKHQQKNALRDAAVIELLFATGMRISELCSLQAHDVNLWECTVLIHGKGSKERIVQIGNEDVIHILLEYQKEFQEQISQCRHFFANQNGSALSDQAIRRMINKYTSLAAIEQHITPHMFRHPYVKPTTKKFKSRNPRLSYFASLGSLFSCIFLCRWLWPENASHYLAFSILVLV